MNSILNHPNPLIRMASNAIAGAVLGLVAGLVFGLIIRFVSELASLALHEDPESVAPFLGMGVGSFVGAVLGGLVGLKK